MTDIKIGNYIVTPLQDAPSRLSLLLWGSSGCGKTTLAATAPGKILWINFDPDGTASIRGRDDILLLDLVGESGRIAEELKKDDPMGLDKFLAADESIQTIVFDSLTTYKDKILPYAIKVAQSTAKGRSSTIEDPGFSGYGNINTWIRVTMENLLRVSKKHNRNIIFIAHEDKPEKNDQGIVLYISIMLGSSLNEQVPVKISEVWWMNDTGKSRTIAVRAVRNRKPMKTRMFLAEKEAEFTWRFDANTWEGEGIAEWLKRWQDAGTKIPLPR